MPIRFLASKFKRKTGLCPVCRRVLEEGSRFEWCFFKEGPPVPAHPLCVTPLSRDRQVQYFVDRLIRTS